MDVIVDTDTHLMVRMTPLPALPAPATTILWSLSASGVSPCTFMAPYKPASTVAAVPWMSSLNIRYSFLYLGKNKTSP